MEYLAFKKAIEDESLLNKLFVKMSMLKEKTFLKVMKYKAIFKNFL